MAELDDQDVRNAQTQQITDLLNTVIRLRAEVSALLRENETMRKNAEKAQDRTPMLDRPPTKRSKPVDRPPTKGE